MYLINKDYNRLEVDKEEVWSALGWKNQPVTPEITGITEEVIDLALKVAQPKSVLLTGELNRNSGLSFYDLYIEGEDLPGFLKTSNEAALMAVTLGIGMDREIKILESSDLAKALQLDAAASILTEKICEIETKKLENLQKMTDKYITERYSPGYGDAPLSLQPHILKLLDAPRRIGLTCNESNLLIPRKSVTAFIGIMDEPRAPRFNRCKHCRLNKECKYGICAFEQ